MSTKPIIQGVVDERLIADLLLHDNPKAKRLGRLMATGAARNIEDWINGEIARDEEMFDVFHTLSQFAVQCLGSLILTVCDSEGDKAISRGLAGMFGSELSQYLENGRTYQARSVQ